MTTSQPLVRRGRALTGLLTLGVAAATLFPSGAHADPPLTLDQAQSQLNDLQRQQEAAVEAYNDARTKAGTAAADEAKAQAAVESARADLDAQSARISELVARQYEAVVPGALVGAVVASDPSAYLNSMAVGAEVDRNRVQELATLQTARKRVADAEKTQQQKATETTALLATASTQQATYQSKVFQAQQVVDRLSAEEKARLLAQQQAEAAAAAKARQDALDKAAATAAAAKAALVSKPVVQAVAPVVAAATTAVAPVTAPVAAPVAAAAAPVVAAPVSASGRAAAAIQYAYAEEGKPYVYGAAGPNSYDCSGLVQWVFAKAGVSLPRTATAQYYATQRISAAQLQPGDLVFYDFGTGAIDHVGIYLGNGTMIDANHTGSYVGVRALYDGIYGYGRV